MRRRNRKTKSAAYMEYSVRQIRRVAFIVIGLFLLFVVIMGIIWAVPRVWNWAMG
jgi:hypothetical protein